MEKFQNLILVQTDLTGLKMEFKEIGKITFNREALDLDHESWDAQDFIFSNKYFCPICESPEDGKCKVLKE